MPEGQYLSYLSGARDLRLFKPGVQNSSLSAEFWTTAIVKPSWKGKALAFVKKEPFHGVTRGWLWVHFPASWRVNENDGRLVPGSDGLWS